MDFRLGEEQAMLRDTLSRYLSEADPLDARLKRRSRTPADDATLWRALAVDLGVVGAALPEEAGGLGGGAVETMIVMEALGEALALAPYLSTVVLGAGALVRAGHVAPLPQVADGSVRLALAALEPDSRFAWHSVETRALRHDDRWWIDGAKCVVLGAPDADWLIVSARTAGDARDRDGVSLFLVEAAQATRHDYRLIDGTPAADLVLEGASGTLLGEAGTAVPVLEAVGDAGIAAICAEAAGLARRMLADTLAWTRERRQFGQPLASFQVLQHRMVDMYMAAEQIQSAAYLATLSLDDEPAARGRAVAAAKAVVADGLRFVAQNAVQLHGAMGITDELPVGHAFKRATVIERQFGGADHQLARYATLAA